MKISLALAAAVTLLGASTSSATTFHYSFSPTSYYDYGTPSVHNPVTGAFDFDSVTGTLSNVDYTSVSGHFTTGAEYYAGDATQIYFGPFGTSNYDVYQLAGSLAGGGTVTISSGTHPSIPISAAGSLTVGAVGGVPEPDTWALMLLGFGGLGFALRSRRTRQSLAA